MIQVHFLSPPWSIKRSVLRNCTLFFTWTALRLWDYLYTNENFSLGTHAHMAETAKHFQRGDDYCFCCSICGEWIEAPLDQWPATILVLIWAHRWHFYVHLHTERNGNTSSYNSFNLHWMFFILCAIRKCLLL